MNHHTRARHRFTAIAVAIALTTTGAVVTGHAAAAVPATLSATAPAPQAASKVMVTTADLNLRKSPSTSAKIITTLKKGTKVTVIGSSGIWRKVNVGKRTGWVSGKFLANLPAKTALKVTSITPVSGSTVISGKQVRVTGTASKNLAGKTLKAQVKVGGAWQTLSAKPKVTSKGTFTFTTKAKGVGKTAYRVVFKATTSGKRLAGSTASRSVTVWKWLKLAEQTIVDAKAELGGHAPTPSMVTMAGETYADGLRAYGYGRQLVWAEFNTSFQCKSFTALAGVDDSSESDATGTSWISTDGEDVTSTSVNLALGQPTRISVDLTDTMRLRLSVQGTNSARQTVTAAWGEARMLCKKDVNPRD